MHQTLSRRDKGLATRDYYSLAHQTPPTRGEEGLVKGSLVASSLVPRPRPSCLREGTVCHGYFFGPADNLGELVKPGTRNEEMGNGKWEMTEIGKSNGRCVTRSTQQHCNRARCDDEEPAGL